MDASNKFSSFRALELFLVIITIISLLSRR
jgi:hypothetical protein